MNGTKHMAVKKTRKTKVVRRKAEKAASAATQIISTPEVLAFAQAPKQTRKKAGRRKKNMAKAIEEKAQHLFRPQGEAPEARKYREIANLILVCGQSGVTSLKMGDITISFQNNDPDLGRPAIADLPKTNPVIVGAQANPDLQSDPIKLTDDDRELFRRSNLLVNDPVEYEREIIDSFTTPETPRHARSEPIGH